MRFGLTILAEHRLSDAAAMWRRAQEFGFDHAWTYDHLVWGGLPDSPWFGTLPTLTGGRDGHLDDPPRHLCHLAELPASRHFHARPLSSADISDGRMICGIGAGGDIDSAILGGQPLKSKERFDRLCEFTGLLDRLLTQDHVSHRGTYFGAVDARTRPGPVQRPRIPFVMAANGPRSLRLAVEYGAGWVTTAPRSRRWTSGGLLWHAWADGWTRLWTQRVVTPPP